jgi:hypothetical protein
MIEFFKKAFGTPSILQKKLQIIKSTFYFHSLQLSDLAFTFYGMIQAFSGFSSEETERIPNSLASFSCKFENKVLFGRADYRFRTSFIRRSCDIRNL